MTDRALDLVPAPGLVAGNVTMAKGAGKSEVSHMLLRFLTVLRYFAMTYVSIPRGLRQARSQNGRRSPVIRNLTLAPKMNSIAGDSVRNFEQSDRIRLINL